MNFLETIRTWWKDAPSISRATVVTGALALLIVGGWFLSTDPSHRWVALSEEAIGYEQSGEITKTLETMGVPYRTRSGAGGETVMVPQEDLAKVRRKLAEQGLQSAETASVYEERFKSGGPFMTSRMEEALHEHAKARSIEAKLAALEPVRKARVDLAPGSKSILDRGENEPKASVFVDLNPGAGGLKELGVSIQQIVAHAVNGLTPDKVVVVDQYGRRLGNADSDPATALASRSIAIRQEQEAQYEARIVQLLEPIVGYGRVLARVTARMDMNRVELHSEEFDPENAVVRRERKSTDSASSEDRGAGRAAAGVGGNAPQRPANDPNGPSSSTKNENSVHETDYAVPRKVTESTRPMGTIERLSVAVVIDSSAFDAPEAPPEGADGETKEAPVDVEVKSRRAVPMPSQRALAEIVKKAVGFDPVRGDQVELLYTPFSRPEIPDHLVAAAPAGGLAYESIPPWIPFSAVVLVGFALVAFAMFRTERARKVRAEEEKRLAEEEKARIEAEEKEAEESATDALGHVPIKEEVRRLAGANLRATTQVMKDWLSVMGTRST